MITRDKNNYYLYSKPYPVMGNIAKVYQQRIIVIHTAKDAIFKGYTEITNNS
ncbi:hypothetical protein [Winogradskyella sp.]|uniref:hypothetical protein n=1 Tax=Winogradskyella sp. TaxID=1883156 RepID=UPI003AB40791